MLCIVTFVHTTIIWKISSQTGPESDVPERKPEQCSTEKKESFSDFLIIWDMYGLQSNMILQRQPFGCLFLCVPSMALILLVKVQSRVFTAKCSEPQVGTSNGMDEGSGVTKFLSLRTET